jgi:hypothetical protein
VLHKNWDRAKRPDPGFLLAEICSEIDVANFQR